MRVTVSGGGRRADLALPASVPVTEVLPELARTLGLLDPATVHHGHRVTTLDGRPLEDELGLVPQGIVDGAVLVVAPAEPEDPPPRHDDVAEAVDETVRQVATPWSPAAARRTTLGAGGVLLAVGLGALVSWSGAAATAVVAGIGFVLCGVAVAADRVRGERAVAGVAAWLAVLHVSVAGGLLASPGVGWGMRVAVAGAVALLAGLGGLAALRCARSLVLPLVLLGGPAAVAGLVVALADADPLTVGPVSLVVAVLAGNVVPRLALGVRGVHAQARVETPAAAAQLREDVGTGHRVLLAGDVAVGIALVGLVPMAVATGTAGAGLAVVSAAVVMLRSRHRADGAQVLVAIVAGTAALTAAVVVGAVAHPGWLPALAVGVPMLGLAAVVLALVPSVPVVRLRRWGDVLEACGVVALLPLLVLAVGWFDAVRG